MIKAILFDLDGVIIHREGFFSERLAKQQNLDLETDVSPFFQGEFKDCLTGRKNLRDVLVPWLLKWKWQGDIDSFLTFWFESERDIDNTMLEEIENLKNKGVRIFLATDNEVNRLDYVLDTLGLRSYFEGIYGSALIGYKKSAREFWEKILSSLPELKPEEILFIDDDPKNTQLAAEFGLKTITFAKSEKLTDRLLEFEIK